MGRPSRVPRAAPRYVARSYLMTPGSARRRAGLLLYAAVQFVVLVAIAMAVYAGGTYFDRQDGGYHFAHNFLSDLGATRAWTGRSNTPSAILFSLALGTMGLAFVAFAGAWRAFAFERRRFPALGYAAQAFGTASGAAFFAVACTPVDRALDLHNTFVLCAFGFLLGYACAITALQWHNGAPRRRLRASIAYVLVVAAYFAVVMYAVSTGITTERGWELLVVSQKVIAAASMVFIAYLTIEIRRQLR